MVAIGTSDECDKSIIHSIHFICVKESNPHLMHSKSVPAYPSFSISTSARIIPMSLHSELGTD